MRLALLSLVLVVFVAFEIEAVAALGYVGVFEALASNAATRLAFLDLVISLGLVLIWMGKDASERALPFVPYLVATLALGSVGPLAYLIHRELNAGRATTPQRA